jgi:hypothetical protein
VDIYGNDLIRGGNGDEIEILALYVDHSEWNSEIGIEDLPGWSSVYGKDTLGLVSDNADGSYSCQITIYRAGKYTFQIKVNGQHILNSPWSEKLLVKPTSLYAPACIPKDIPTDMEAGVQYTFQIQSRDFYSNNRRELLSTIDNDYSIIYTHEDGTTQVEAALED